MPKCGPRRASGSPNLPFAGVGSGDPFAAV